MGQGASEDILECGRAIEQRDHDGGGTAQRSIKRRHPFRHGGAIIRKYRVRVAQGHAAKAASTLRLMMIDVDVLVHALQLVELLQHPPFRRAVASA